MKGKTDMCTESEQRDMQREMAAYDALPDCLKRVFDEAPRKVSVINTLSLPAMARCRSLHGDTTFAGVLKAHLQKQAEQEAKVSV